MMYLGSPGRLVGVKCPTRQQVAASERFSFQRTLEGRVKAQTVPLQRRAWDIELGQLTTPSEVATLQEFAQGAWGPGPFWFVPADAPVVNMLTPDASRCDPDSIQMGSGAELLGSPPMNLGDGKWAAQSVWKTTANGCGFGGNVPVLEGQSVTGSLWVIGAGRARLLFSDAAGGTVSTVDSAMVGSSEASRIHVTAQVPAGAVTARLWVTAPVSHAARPAMTWTDQPYEFGDGQGCEKAIVHAVNRDVTKAWDNPNTGRWSNLSFTVQEVG